MLKQLVFAIALFLVILSVVLAPSVAGVVSGGVVFVWLLAQLFRATAG